MNQELLRRCRVLPVVTATDVASTVQLAGALSRGGMKAIEITLRTEAALESIRAVKDQVPEMLVAAGTVTTPAELEAAMKAGADFCVSPGATPRLLEASNSLKADFLPGIATASELMQGLEYGFSCFKLFPAVAVGGINLLNSLKGPFPNARFCPTGGLSPENYRDFLNLSNVVCCGGSWMASEKLVSTQQWDVIESLAREAMAENA